MLLVGLLIVALIGRVAWVKKHGQSSDVWSYLPGLVLLAAVMFFLPRFFPEGLPIRGYGVMVLLGSLAGIWLAVVRAGRRGLHADVIYSLAFAMFICGIVGARIFFRTREECWTSVLEPGWRSVRTCSSMGATLHGSRSPR